MKTLEELNAVREQYRDVISVRKQHKPDSVTRRHVLVCGGTGCTSSHSEEIIQTLHTEIEAQGLSDRVEVVRTGCFGLCALGPIMIVYPEGSFYSMMKVENVHEIVTEHLAKGNVVTRLLYNETVRGDEILPLDATPFYRRQNRVALRNCGVIDPESLEEYIAIDGYQALGKVLTEYDAGAGHPGHHRLPVCAAAAAADSPPAANGRLPRRLRPRRNTLSATPTRATPARFMDRSVLEGDPHCDRRSHGDRGLCHRRDQGLCLCPRRIPDRRSPPADRDRRGARSTVSSAKTSSAPALISTWRSVWAQARSSAARKPR